jgi:hypothetical protein
MSGLMSGVEGVVVLVVLAVPRGSGVPTWSTGRGRGWLVGVAGADVGVAGSGAWGDG